MLYIRQFVVMVIQLYSVRCVLNILGVENFGIYNVISGSVMLLNFLTATMSSATQRFFSFALGQKNTEKLCVIYETNFTIYFIVALSTAVIFETAGLWFICNKLTIPAAQVSEAKILYHFMVISFLFSFVSSPSIAIIIAHEDMGLYAKISIFDAVMKLLILIPLHYLPYQKLPLYGLLLAIVALVTAAAYSIICCVKYQECRLKKFTLDKAVFKEILGFTGWTLFGCLSTMFRSQAITILLNQFFTPVVVAARAIALNIASAMNAFTSNFNTGLYPPIIKAWSADKKEEMYALVYTGCKITFSLIWVCSLPFLLEMDFLLQVWLKNPPPEAALFSRLALIESIILSVTLPIATAARAPGKMKTYELTLGIIQCLIFPFSWLVLALGGAAYTTLVIAIIANVIMLFVRIYIVHNLTGLPLKPFFKEVLQPISYVLLSSLVFCLPLNRFIRGSAFLSCLVIICSFFLTFFSIFCFGLKKREKESLFIMLRNKITGKTIL